MKITKLFERYYVIKRKDIIWFKGFQYDSMNAGFAILLFLLTIINLTLFCIQYIYFHS